MLDALKIVFRHPGWFIELSDEKVTFEEREIPSGFETIGDIVHMNFTKKAFPFRYVVGQVVLDKNPKIRSVICKIGFIDNIYRVYNLECIAGEKGNYGTIHIEDKVRFNVDVSKVYWCSKLAFERNRMIWRYLQQVEVLCDMFCGIGALTVKSAVKQPGMRGVCNDLNPEAIKYCNMNIKLNKVTDRVVAFNMDAREFVRFYIA